MSNAETPAESTGGNTATSATAPLSSIPPRIRVHALAKLLGKTSRELLDKLAAEGLDARSPQSSVTRGVALRLAESYGVTDSGAADEAVQETAAGAADAESAPQATSGAAPAGGPKAPAAEAPTAQATGSGTPAEPATGPGPSAGSGTQPAAADQPRKPGVPQAPEQLFSAPQPPQAEPPTSPPFSGQPPAPAPVFAPPAPVFVQPEEAEPIPASTEADEESSTEEDVPQDGESRGGEEQGTRRRRRRGRRGRGRGKGESSDQASDQSSGSAEPGESEAQEGAKPDQKGAEDASGSAKDDDKKADKKADKKDDSSADKKADDSSADTAGGEGSAGSENASSDEGSADSNGDESEGSTRRRRRRRRRRSSGDDAISEGADDESSSSKSAEDQVRSVRGSTRLEAKRQRRRDGREAGRRRAPILSEAEFLARRESVERTMVVREQAGKGERTTQIGVLEDGVLVEHFVTSSGQGSIVGNVYLGRVQNVLPSMEAAFVDIGRGRNAVLYAGEVDWDAAGLEGKSRKIEQALSTGDQVLVQVTKDPVGHKGARLTTQISLPGRYLVYVPGGGATGISRKLPENERRRLKEILKRIVPDDAGVIIRTASEGISEEELARDINRLKAQWETICEKAGKVGNGGKKGKKAPALLYEEPDLLVKVVRDLFTEDFSKLVVQGSVAWETIESYVQNVAPDLADRLERYTGTGDVFHDYRIDEQITKALDRKVWLPSGGYLVIDRTEAMTVIDVNTGKFTGSGGNLEETVTRNNLESAEEIVRQLRLRDIGGIIVIDFIDMVLESNRELVLRRLTECLARDRTRHQVAEVTSLGLVQMTRKRVGTGLLEAYSTPCEHCKGRGVIVSTEPRLAPSGSDGGGGGKQGRKRGKQESAPVAPEPTPQQRESVASAVAAIASAAAKPKQSGSEGGTGTAVKEALSDRTAGEKVASPQADAGLAESAPAAGTASAEKKTPAEKTAPTEKAAAVEKSAPAEKAAAAEKSAPAERTAAAESAPAAKTAAAEKAPEADTAPATETAEESSPTAAATAPETSTETKDAAPAGRKHREEPARPASPGPDRSAEGDESAATARTSDEPAAGRQATPAAGAEREGALAASSGGQPTSDARQQSTEGQSSQTGATTLRTSAVRQTTKKLPVSRPAGPPVPKTPPVVKPVHTAPAGSPGGSEVVTPVARPAPRRARRAASRPAGPPQEEIS